MKTRGYIFIAAGTAALLSFAWAMAMRDADRIDEANRFFRDAGSGILLFVLAYLLIFDKD